MSSVLCTYTQNKELTFCHEMMGICLKVLQNDTKFILQLYILSVSESFNKQTERKLNEYPSKCHTFALENKLQQR